MRTNKFKPSIILFLFIAFSSVLSAQNGDPIFIIGHPPPDIMVYIGAGSNSPSTKAKDDAYATNTIGFDANVFVSVIKKKNFSFGFNGGGEYFSSNKDPLKTLPNPFHVIGETSSIVSSSGKSKQQSFNVGAGPQANFYLGKHIIVSPIFLVGYMSLTQNAFSATQTTVIDDNTSNYNLLSQTQTKTNGLALISKLRLQYFLNRRIGFWAETNYTMGPIIKNTVNTFIPQGTPDNNGQYEFDQLQNGTTKTEIRQTKFGSFGVHVGVMFGIALDRMGIPNKSE